MSLNIRWGKSALEMKEFEFNAHAESVAFWMMFCGIQEITAENAKEFAFRWQLWDVAVSGETTRSLEYRISVIEKFVGTSANVTPKTLHQFVTGDIKRIVKEKS